MRPAVRWAVGCLAAVLVVCLLVWARGPEHHRGSEVGSSAPAVVVVGG